MKVVFHNKDLKPKDNPAINLLDASTKAYASNKAYYESMGLTETEHKKKFNKYYKEMFGS